MKRRHGIACAICGYELVDPTWPVEQMEVDGRPFVPLNGPIHHPAPMPPAIAEHVVGRFSNPGDLVFSPMAGKGTELFTALAHERDALGVEIEPELVNIVRVQGIADVRVGDARHLRRLDLPGFPADLALFSPPYLWKRTANPRTGDVGNADDRDPVTREFPRGKGANVRRRARAKGYGTEQGNIGSMVRNTLAYAEAMAQVYSECMAVTKGGGHLAVVVADSHRDYRHVPCARLNAVLAEKAGFEPVVWIQAKKLRGGRPSLNVFDPWNVARITGLCGDSRDDPAWGALKEDPTPEYQAGLWTQATEHILVARRPKE